MVSTRAEGWMDIVRKRYILFLVKHAYEEAYEHGFPCLFLGMCGVRFPRKYTLYRDSALRLSIAWSMLGMALKYT